MHISKSYFLPQYSVRESALEKYKTDYEEATDRLKESMLFFNNIIQVYHFLFVYHICKFTRI